MPSPRPAGQSGVPQPAPYDELIEYRIRIGSDGIQANVFADAADRYPTVTLDEARARRPDVVLAPSEPYPFGERHVPLLADVAPVVLVDGQDLFWWGARTVAAADRLRAQLADVPPGA
jgi:hypothetical protein